MTNEQNDKALRLHSMLEQAILPLHEKIEAMESEMKKVQENQQKIIEMMNTQNKKGE